MNYFSTLYNYVPAMQHIITELENNKDACIDDLGTTTKTINRNSLNSVMMVKMARTRSQRLRLQHLVGNKAATEREDTSVLFKYIQPSDSNSRVSILHDTNNCVRITDPLPGSRRRDKADIYI